MNLELPDPSITAGPAWAEQLNEALELVDLHDHSSGKGVKVTPAGMNINATLEVNSNDVSEINSLLLDDRIADIVSRGIYAKNGDLFYRNTAGNSVQITSGSSVAGATGSITGLSSPASASYSSLNEQFTWQYDSSKLAKMSSSDLIVYPYDGSTAFTKSVTLKAPAGLEALSSYSITLPTGLAGAVELLNMDASGILNHATLSGTANQVSVSLSATAITLSTPQNIHTAATPTFAGLTLSGALSVSTTLGVTGATTLSSTLAVTGATTLSAALSGTSASFSSSMAISGITTLGDDIRGVDGSLASPSFTFANDQDTGLYRSGSDAFSLVTGGSARLSVSSTQVSVPGGSASTPAIGFVSDLDTGIYRSADNLLGLAAGGAEHCTIGSNQFRVLDGSSSVPSLTFISNTNTGFHHSSSVISATIDGTDQFNVGVEGIQTDSGGYFKAKVFTGSVSASSFATLDVGAGNVIIGAHGYDITDRRVMSDPSAGSGFLKWASNSASATSEVRIFNNDGSNSHSYRAIVFYQES